MCVSSTSYGEKSIFITVGSDSSNFTKKYMGTLALEVLSTKNKISIIETKESFIPQISAMMHEEFKRCPGFIFHDSLLGAKAEQANNQNREIAKKMIFADYFINQHSIVIPLINSVDHFNIVTTINYFSSFKNRYYKSNYGVDAANWLANYWKQLTVRRADANVEVLQHSGWPQASVILTLKGRSDEVVVIGGHLDSISKRYFGARESKAPCADDNASGIATITEIIRVLIDNDYRPAKTLKFIGYGGRRSWATRVKRDCI